ncbi:exo 1,3/1,4-beta-D-glucan glucohydrolase [Sphingomonas floccifaciens]|uniref:Exo 1,3/1,4-beta-D-glucan glucohydrolase n=1 Tax=Sphingomonas floccifaciens TaxID=1844115 RepID=A0ABW4NEG1_9SPHN
MSLLFGLSLSGLAAIPIANAQDATPAGWPARVLSIAADPKLEAQIDTLIAAMSLEQKVGQIVQGDIASVTPDDVYRYHLGSVLNGGNSDPGGRYNAPAKDWLAAADAYYAASMKPNGKLPRIPVMWGSDAVHGHNNVVGATLFPHNIALGATRNPELLRRIGEVTAIEMRVTGLDWTFAPTLAVVRDDRWGRTYEGFGEAPEIASSYARPLIEGLQGKVGDRDWLRGPHIIATAKHFLGDGGTTGGKDQGDTQISESGLRTLFSPPYLPALDAGVQSVMVSFSSWNGAKMHGNRSLLTGVMKERWNFDGFLVGDWNGHGQVAGCSPTSCAPAIAAGLDMFMAPDSWKALYDATLAQVKAGTLPMARLDDAVRRILRVKLRAGLFEAGKPSSRPYGGKFELLGSAEHRAVARQAVRESLVLLKNAGSVLPLRPGANILVAGDGADNLTKQTGGWTLSWQGTGTKPDDFPNAESIWQGIDAAVKDAGGTATLSVDGRYAKKPDAAIVVFGEDPYAEFQGDRPDVGYDDAKSLALLKSLKAAGVPTVAVFLSGRAMWVNPFLNAADAFVAAWLPGSEGGGVADVLFGKAQFRGKLPYSWPRASDQTAVNVGDAKYDPLFPYGFGLTTADRGDLAPLPEVRATASAADIGTVFAAGKPGAGRRLLLGKPGELSTNPGPTLIDARAADRVAQEDSVRIRWTGAGLAMAAIAGEAPVDLSRQSNGELALEMEFKVNAAPTADVSLLMACGAGCSGGFPLRALLTQAAANPRWTRLAVPLRCFEKAGVDMKSVTQPLAIATAGTLDITLSSARITSPSGPVLACK